MKKCSAFCSVLEVKMKNWPMKLKKNEHIFVLKQIFRVLILVILIVRTKIENWPSEKSKKKNENWPTTAKNRRM